MTKKVSYELLTNKKLGSHDGSFWFCFVLFPYKNLNAYKNTIKKYYTNQELKTAIMLYSEPLLIWLFSS